MIKSAKLPPIYTFVPIDGTEDPVARALAMAADGADPATIICADRPDRLDCAIILHPDMPAAESRLVIYAAMLGLGDALGNVVPAGIDVTYQWPNTIEANIGTVARLTLSLAPSVPEDEIAPWMVLGVVVAIDEDPVHHEEGDDRGHEFETSLAGEGAVEVTTVNLIESFSRHFLTWISRWQDDGFEPLRLMWIRHTTNHKKPIRITMGKIDSSGTFEDLAPDGALILQTPETTHHISLADVLSG